MSEITTSQNGLATSLKNKTILLHSEQGLGDSIQFSRYLSFFNQMDCEVLLEIEDSLHTLMTSFLPITKIYSKNKILPTFDYHCSLVSLPLAFKTSAVSIPNKTPYIKIFDKTRIDWLEKTWGKRKPRIGFCWHGNASHSRDKIRSVPLDIFLSHLHLTMIGLSSKQFIAERLGSDRRNSSSSTFQ